MHPARPENPLFPAGDSRLLHIWDRMQRLQTDFCVNQELGVYYTTAKWRSARRVLDVGTGNGYYLGRIAEHFPDKTYTGIDSSQPLLEVAKREMRGRDIALYCADLADFEADAPFDFLLMRLFLQHVPSVSEALNDAARLTCAGGSVLVIDALDAARFFAPPAREFSTFFETYATLQRERSRERRVGEGLRAALRGRSDWKLGEQVRLVIPSTIPGNSKLFEENYGLFIDLVEIGGDLDYDFDAVRRSWAEWCRLEQAFTQVGLDVLCLERA